MRGLPSREWRTADYGATQQVTPPGWREKLLIRVAFVFEKFRIVVNFIYRCWKSGWTWALSRKTRGAKIIASGLFILVSILFGFSLFMSILNWLRKEDPCRVMERSKFSLLEEDSNEGVFTQLPKKIHFAWDNEYIPAGRLLEWNQEFKRLFPTPDYQHVFWTREKFLSLIRERYPWYFLEADTSDEPIQFRREARYFILNEHGGVFASADYQVLRNFWDALPKSRPAILSSPYRYGSDVEDALISSPPGHPLWNITLGLIRTRLQSRLWFANSRVLAQGVEQLKNSPMGVNAIYELPCENFYRFSAGESAEFIPTWRAIVRSFASFLGFVKSCGDVESSKCHYGVYHENALAILGNA